MSSNFKMLFTLYAISTVGEIFAFVPQYPKSPRGNVVLYGEFLYTCKEIISEYAFVEHLIDEIVTRKSLCIDFNSRTDMYSRFLFCFMLYWWSWVIEKFYTYPAKGFRCFRSWLYMG